MAFRIFQIWAQSPHMIGTLAFVSIFELSELGVECLLWGEDFKEGVVLERGKEKFWDAFRKIWELIATLTKISDAWNSEIFSIFLHVLNISSEKIWDFIISSQVFRFVPHIYCSTFIWDDLFYLLNILHKNSVILLFAKLPQSLQLFNFQFFIILLFLRSKFAFRNVFEVGDSDHFCYF